VTKGREKLAVNKQRSYRIYIESFNLRKLNEGEDIEQYCVGVSNGMAVVENLDAKVEVNS
jgi:hypothetical protein